MAHYDNFAARFIDYSNHQLFESFFEFFVYGRKMANEYWKYHKPTVSRFTSLKSEGVEELTITQKINNFILNHGWKAKAFLHYIYSFLLRLALLPFTAIIYTVSRTALIVCNPFTAWSNNPRKAIYMGLVWAVPAFIAMNNHVHNIMPDLRFSSPFTIDNFQRISSTFGLSDGFWGMGSAMTGGLITSIFLSIGMACVLLLAKKAAQNGNAVKFTDPRQTHYYDPANMQMNQGKRTVKSEHLVRSESQRDFVMITAPKHRHVPISNLENESVVAELADPFNNLNSGSANVRYACYENRNKRPIIWSTTPHSIKRYLNAFDARAREKRPSQYGKKLKTLHIAYDGVKTSDVNDHNQTNEVIHKTYRIIPLVDSQVGKK